jgi:predicted DNA-binding protein with PD1-like motif
MARKRIPRYLKRGSTYVIRLEKGERIIESLEAFCRRKRIKAAFFQGIGTCRRAELGFFRLTEKRYSFRMLRGEYEIAALLGNVSLLGERPFVHAHIVLGGRDFASRSGHLKEAEVLATCEIFLLPWTGGLSRKIDRRTGLRLLDWVGQR